MITEIAPKKITYVGFIELNTFEYVVGEGFLENCGYIKK